MIQTGVYVGNDPAALATYSKWMGSTPGNVLNYLNNDSWSAFDSSIGYEVNLWKATTTPSIWSVPLTVWGTSLEQVATGAYDDHFLKAAQGLAQTKASSDGNIYVRVGWEFNGSWMPWAANGHEAAFIKAFQELVTTFRSVSDKFKFVWDTTNDGGNMNPEKAYPGDKYVDVIGTDVYYSTQWDGTDAAKGFKGEVTRTYGLQWQQDFAAAHGKATAISEWGVASDNAAPYVQAMTKWMTDHNMVYENYWDSNADYSGKLSTGANATAGAAYKGAIASLASSGAHTGSADNQQADAVFRFYDTQTLDHFYTTSVAEKLNIMATLPTYQYEGVAWGTPHQASNTIDVFRFYDTNTKSHFFTTSTAERDTILTNLPAYQYEGVAFEAFSQEGGTGTVTLDRFYNTITHQHHFSAGSDETASILAGNAGAGWNYEGHGFTVMAANPDLLNL